ncbi:MAG: TraR/DksA family transcriptional regulator [Gemmatimonadota bacterium]
MSGPPLSVEQLAELRGELERQLVRLERSMKITEHAARPVELDQTAVGRLSRMDALQNQHLMKNLQEREEMRLAAIHEALGRLEAGTYGTCTECDESIGFDRLYVVPEAADCGRCR